MVFWAKKPKPSSSGSVSGAPVEIDGGNGGQWWGVGNKGGAVGWGAHLIKRAGDGVLGQKTETEWRWLSSCCTSANRWRRQCRIFVGCEE
jgi:hypothetical protein